MKDDANGDTGTLLLGGCLAIILITIIIVALCFVIY